MNSIYGVIVSGMGAARNSIAKQKQFLTPYCPDLSGCHEATLNVYLMSPLRILRWDIKTDIIEWKPGAREWFKLLRIEFSYDGRDAPGWVYQAQHTPHRRNPFLVELLLPKFDLSEEKLCRLTFPRQLDQMTMCVLS